MKKSKSGSVNWFDVLKTLLITAGTTLTGSLIPIISTGKFPDHAQITLILGASVGAGLTYILKQFGTNSNGELLKKETP